MLKIKNNLKALKGLFTGLLVLFTFMVWGQQSQFSKVCKPSVASRGVIESNNYYYSVNQTFNDSVGGYAIRLIKLDSTGRIVKEKLLLSEEAGGFFPSNHISLIKTLDGHFVTNINIAGTLPTKRAILKFDTNLDTLWLRYFVDKGLNIPAQIKQLPNGQFVLTGTDYDSTQNKSGAFLMLADVQGNYLWHKTYYEPDSFSLFPLHVYPAPNGGFLMAGTRMVANFDYLETRDPILMRTDSLGNLLWQKTYGGNSYDDIANAGYLNGRIILFYCQQVRPYFSRYISGPVFQKVSDVDGSVVQTKNFPFIDGFDMASFQMVLEEDKIIGVGSLLDNYRSEPEAGVGKGYTLAVDTNFNPLWFRYYTLRDSTPDSGERSYLYDLRPTSDGGYVGAGYVIVLDTANTGANFGYTAWIIKLDSNGCLRPSCDNRISKPEFSQEEEMLLSIYPNPAKDHINISMPDAKEAQIELVDAYGRVVQSTVLHQGNALLTLNPPLPSGLYFVRVIREHSKVYNRRIIIE
tara:strand:- start:206 stop:1762 length:1557 start_codon:yes stop_codon:yes gene_type:complete